jgi:hypothetical protein
MKRLDTIARGVILATGLFWGATLAGPIVGLGLAVTVMRRAVT